MTLLLASHAFRTTASSTPCRPLEKEGSFSPVNLTIKGDTVHFGSKRSQPSPTVLRHLENHRFLPHTPEQALELSWDQLVPLLKIKVGAANFETLMANQPIASPKADEKNGEWLKQSKIIGVHPRIVGTYLGLVKYAMTFPEDAIHLLPVRTPGAGNSLYAPIRWDTSTEMMDPELSKLGLNTPEKQLKWAINALHAMGKTVGLDIQPHMDRFAEPVFTHPDLFEWAYINKSTDNMISQQNTLSREVSLALMQYLYSNLPEGVSASDVNQLYFPTTSEEKRGEILFGPISNPEVRQARRIALMNYLRSLGYETLPTPMFYHCRPFRYLGEKNDGKGNTWAEFDIPDRPEYAEMRSTRVFGSIAPFKWHHTENGIPQTHRPNYPVWDYYAHHIQDDVKAFGFDFLRVDMPYAYLSTKEDRPPSPLGRPYPKSIWEYVKQRCQAVQPHTATFAEAFFDPKSTQGNHEDPHQHIGEHQFDVALGNQQYQDLDESWMEKARKLNLITFFKQLPYKISHCVMTADSDDAKFNPKYPSHIANRIRLFAALFLNQPSYMGCGFEQRADQNGHPALNTPQKYTRHFIDGNLKRMAITFKWGMGIPLSQSLQRIRKTYQKLQSKLAPLQHRWLDTGLQNTDLKHVGLWLYETPDKAGDSSKPKYVFALNSHPHQDVDAVSLDPLDGSPASEEDKTKPIELEPIFSTDYLACTLAKIKGDSKKPMILTRLAPGEGRIYRVKGES
jgi:hypothetical protein